METEKLITVTGRGDIHVVPDVTRLTIQIESLFQNYDTAYKMAQANLKDICNILEANKLDKKMAKTIRFNIERKVKSKYDKYHNYEGEEFIGYGLEQHVKIDLGMDNELLSSIIQGIGRSLTDTEINIGHTVKDPRPSQLKMLERAIKDATEKAKIMAEAAGCTLGLVKSIDYSEREIHIYSQARSVHNCEEAIGCNAASLDITPDDLCAGENVTITWYLSNNVNK